MNKSRSFFSVIMPVYNAEKTLSVSIGSILTQTFSDHEFIIIENGSTDKSLAVARAYAAAFPKLRVLKSEQKGVSHARNMGLDNARGEYVVFLDADDRYVPDALETMHASLEKSGADLLLSGFLGYPMCEDGSLAAVEPRLLYLYLLDPPLCSATFPASASFMHSEFSLRHQCSRAYKRSFLADAGIRFDERCPMYVDFLFNRAVYAACKRPYLVFRRLYGYNRKVDGSLTHRAAAALIEDTRLPFLLIAKEADALTGEDRAAHIYAAFMMLVSMINACASDHSNEAYAALTSVLGTPEAGMVFSELRSERLHIVRKKNELLKELLALMKNNDIDGALRLMKSFGEKR